MSVAVPAQPSVRTRIAGAPISWGVCEVPDWGYQLPVDRVLHDMRRIGLTATEFGPEGFLPADPRARADYLDRFGLRAVGGFLPVVMHDPALDPAPLVEAYLEVCLAAGAGVVVLAAATGGEGYDARPRLDAASWRTLADRLDELAEQAARRGLLAVLHPHVGTMIEDADDVARVIADSRIGLCLDTGHLAAAGADPVAIAVAHPERIGHVHLKDVDAALAAEVVSGGLAFSEAVSRGMWTRLGEGSVDIGALIAALESHGYRGWYVLEQDLRLTGEPDGEGPIADVRRCLAYVEARLA